MQKKKKKDGIVILIQFRAPGLLKITVDPNQDFLLMQKDCIEIPQSLKIRNWGVLPTTLDMLKWGTTENTLWLVLILFLRYKEPALPLKLP